MAGNSVKSTLPSMAVTLVVLLIVLILPVNIVFQLYTQHKSQQESSTEVFAQLKQLIDLNESDLKRARSNFSEKCLRAAEMAAYFTEHFPHVKEDLPHIQGLAEKLGVDELHFFNPEGVIVSGTDPVYYGYSFHSGEQMEFFLPMLEDKTLRLCQDITPNTARGKPMQYAAVWLRDGSGIVQIGMAPVQLIQDEDARSLPQILATLPTDLRGYLYVVDTDSKTIVASTAQNMVGLDVSQYDQWDTQEQQFHSRFDGRQFCVYTSTYDHYLFVRTYLSSYPLRDLVLSSVSLTVYILLVAGVVIALVAWYVDRQLARNLLGIIEQLRGIQEGRLETISMKTNIAEFDELICYINQLISSIQANWNKLSYVIDKGRLPIGIFEYNGFYKKAFFNRHLLTILGTESWQDLPREDQARKILQLLERVLALPPVGDEENIYRYQKQDKTIYLRIDQKIDDQSRTFYITDVSLWWEELHVLREQNNRDDLTGLFNRRGFSERMEEVFAEPETIGYGMMLMLDADRLKFINDRYGHQVGDEYLWTIAHRVAAAAGEQAVCSRLGGDEFVVFLYRYQSRQQVQQILERIQSLRGTAFAYAPAATLEFSVGSALYPVEGQDYHLLMHIADENMYREKRQRKFRETKSESGI